jgi:hypothetical protein
MEIIRRIKNENYTTISNVFLRDKALSLDAKGFLALVMSLPENWDFSVSGITAIVSEGRNHIYNTIKELISLSYAERRFLYEMNPNGKKTRAGVEYTFFEEPLNSKNLNLDNGDLDDLNSKNLNLGFQNFENRAQISKDYKEVKKQTNGEAKKIEIVERDNKPYSEMLAYFGQPDNEQAHIRIRQAIRDVGKQLNLTEDLDAYVFSQFKAYVGFKKENKTKLHETAQAFIFALIDSDYTAKIKNLSVAKKSDSENGALPFENNIASSGKEVKMANGKKAYV